MNRTHILTALALLALLPACRPAPTGSQAAAAIAGSGPAPDAAGYKNYPAVGIIRGFQSDNKVVVIEHQDIPGLMKGMTMGFELKDPALAQGFKAGDAVDFTLSVKDSDFLVTALKKR